MGEQMKIVIFGGNRAIYVFVSKLEHLKDSSRYKISHTTAKQSVLGYIMKNTFELSLK